MKTNRFLLATGILILCMSVHSEAQVVYENYDDLNQRNKRADDHNIKIRNNSPLEKELDKAAIRYNAAVRKHNALDYETASKQEIEQAKREFEAAVREYNSVVDKINKQKGQ
jgi:hypothetical protein